MDKLEVLAQRLEDLAQRNLWQDILNEDDNVRLIIHEVLARAGSAEKRQVAQTLQKIEKIYRDGASYLESSQNESATEIKSIQKGLRAVKSYLDNTGF